MRREVRIEKVLEAPRDAVFRAWTTPEGLRRWWGPGDYTTPLAEVDLRPGGTYHLVMEPPDGAQLHVGGTYREVDPPRRLVYTWQWTSGVPDPRESVVTVEFEDLGSRTRVTLVHDGFDEAAPVEPYESGWQSGFDKLTAFVAEPNHIEPGDSSASR